GTIKHLVLWILALRRWLNLGLCRTEWDRIAHLLAHEGLGHRRYIRQRTQRWLGLVLPHDAIGLSAPVVPLDRHRGAETHLGRIPRRLDHMGGGPARSPVAQVPVNLGAPRSVVCVLARRMLTVKPGELSLDHLEPLPAHEVVWRNRPIGKVVVNLPRIGLFCKGLAHRGTIPCLASRLWPASFRLICGQLRSN